MTSHAKKALVLLAALAPFEALGACNSIFGVSSGTLAEGIAGSGGATTSVTSTTTASTTSGSVGGAAPTGVGGASGSGGGGQGSGGSGGGGAPGCNPYAGGGTFTTTAGPGANVATFTWGAEGSVEGHYASATGVTEITMGGGQQGEFCAMGIHLKLAGPPVPGKTYTPVPPATFDDVATFLAGDNAYVDFGGDPCSPPPTSKWWRSGQGEGSVVVSDVQETMVTFTIQDVVLHGVQDGDTDGQGTVSVFGSGHSDCFNSF